MPRTSRVLPLRRIFAFAVPAALLACQGAGDPLAPDAGSEPPVSAEAAGAGQDVPSPELLGSLATNRIAFTNYTSDGTDIWTMDPQGGTPVRLTSFTGRETNASWSFDRKRIAFSRTRNGNYTDIFLMNADGSNKHWARSATYSGSIDNPSWSPDGTHLLVTATMNGFPYLATIDLATQNLSLVAPQGLFAVQSYTATYDATGAIVYLDAAFKNVKRFTPGGPVTTLLSASVYLGEPAISPDGTRLAYTQAVTPTNGEIYVLNLTTKVSKRLTYSGGGDFGPTWSPDGTKLAFASDRSGTLQIWTMNSATGGSQTRITSRTVGAGYPAWAN
jgi:Tol biopolymer transport system component